MLFLIRIRNISIGRHHLYTSPSWLQVIPHILALRLLLTDRWYLLLWAVITPKVSTVHIITRLQVCCGFRSPLHTGKDRIVGGRKCMQLEIWQCYNVCLFTKSVHASTVTGTAVQSQLLLLLVLSNTSKKWAVSAIDKTDSDREQMAKTSN